MCVITSMSEEGIEEFRDAFRAVAERCLKKQLISLHHQISFFAWKFLDRYPYEFKDSASVEVCELVSSFLVELDQKLSLISSDKSAID